MSQSIEEESGAIANSILDMCRRLVSLLHIASKSSEKQLGLSAAQLFVLKKLSDGQVRSLNDLAQLTYTHQTSVSVVVKKLVEKHLVESQYSKVDARRLELKITAKGHDLLKEAPEPVQERLLRGIHALGPEEIRTFNRLMAKMLNQVERSYHPAQLFFED